MCTTASRQINLWAVNPDNGAVLRTYENAGQCPRGEPKGLACNRTARRLYVYCYNEARNQDAQRSNTVTRDGLAIPALWSIISLRPRDPRRS